MPLNDIPLRRSASGSPHPLPTVGVSACLLGYEVRYDGGHKRNAFLTDDLDGHVHYVSVCPETAIGLGIPRPPIRLVGEPDRPRVVGVDDPSLDVTEQLQGFAGSQLKELARLSGYVLKKDSPSCGMGRVKVYAESVNHARRKGTGAFARVLMRGLPLLPVTDEECLNDAVLRENFINRVYVYQRWQQLLTEGITTARLMDFHTTHKYTVMAHSQAAYRRLGQLLAGLPGNSPDQIAGEYAEELMHTLKRRVGRKRHLNVLRHIMGRLKKQIDNDDKAELNACVEAYRRGETPLAVPITRLKHYLRRHRDACLERQHYLHPYPERLGLRNNI